jgi:hypothetical protein
MTVENVALAAPSPDLYGRERLTLAHGDQDAAQPGAGLGHCGPEVSVEPLRCAVDRTDDAGERDELFAGIPNVPVVAGDVPQNRKG